MSDEPNYTRRSCSPTKSLRKSLRLPRTFPRVAQWLFGEPHLAFHSDTPSLTLQTFSSSLALRNHYVYEGVGGVFDPFGIDDHITQPTVSRSELMQRSSKERLGKQESAQQATVTTDTLFTPVAWAGENVIVGYSNTTGEAFDPNISHQQSGTFRGKSGLNGRFAYDLDNDHFLVVINGITPLVSGIIDISFVGLGRSRSCYTIPNAPYGPKRLPTHVLVLMISLETKSDLNRRSRDFSSPCTSLDLDDVEGISSQGNISKGQQLRSADDGENHPRTSESTKLTNAPFEISLTTSTGAGVQNKYVDDIKELAKCMHNLALNLHGVYKGAQMRREKYDPINAETILSSETGFVTGVHALPTNTHRNKMTIHGWKVYSAWESSEILQTGNGQRRPGLKPIDNSMGSHLHSVKYLTWPGCSSTNLEPETERCNTTIQTEPHSKSNLACEQNFDPSVSLDFSSVMESQRDTALGNFDLDLKEDAAEEGRTSDELVSTESGGGSAVDWTTPDESAKYQLQSKSPFPETAAGKLTMATPIPSAPVVDMKQSNAPSAVLVQPFNPIPSVVPHVVMVPMVQIPVGPIPMALPIGVPAVSPSESNDILGVSVGDHIVKDAQMCNNFNSLSRWKSGVTSDGEMLRIRKLEEKKRRNRLSAARSNEKRRKREIAQKSQLGEQKKLLIELRLRKNILESENESLRRALAQLGLPVPISRCIVNRIMSSEPAVQSDI